MSDLRVTVLGCDGSYPSPGGACSGYLVRTESTSIWLDAGTGTLANLQHHMAPQDLDAVVITHEHADHCANLADLRVMFMCADRKVTEFPVYAAPGVLEGVFPRDPVEPLFTWTELEDGDELEIGDMALSFSRADHGPYTLAVRIDSNDRSFAYSADTGPEWSFTALGAGIDLAMCEAAFRLEEESLPFHVSPRQAGAMAREAGVERLVLTHIRPDHDRELINRQAMDAFGGPVELASIGATYVV